MGKFVWSSLEEVFEKLNQESKYLVLRNFEDINSEGRREGHSDIDILCENHRTTRRVLHGKNRLFGNINHYEVNIAGTVIEFGINYVGDRYYCDEWEKHMLENRRMYEEGFYVLSEEDYMYSLLYHALVHKRNISEKYLLRVEEMATAQGVAITKPLDEFLTEFMNENGYSITYPRDWSVPNDLGHIGFLYRSRNSLVEKLYHILFSEHAIDFSLNQGKPEVRFLRAWQIRKIGALPYRTLRQFVKVIKKEKCKNG